MDFWQIFNGSWGKEFVAGGFGGIAAVISGHPLDTIRVRQQKSTTGSAFNILRHMLFKEGPCSLYRGMASPLFASTLQNAMVFQSYTVLSRALDSYIASKDSSSYKGVILGGVGSGALQSFLISPVELVKIQVQLRGTCEKKLPHSKSSNNGPIRVVKNIWKNEGIVGMYRGLCITMIRDAPSHGVYFWTYEYMKEQLHPGCRKNCDESLNTMLVAGGLAGVTSWIFCYPFDVVKTRLQAQTPSSMKYEGIFDCFLKIVREEGHSALWRGVETAVARAFVVNGAIFAAYEATLRILFHNNRSNQMQDTI
ncbi:hypothetical protein Lal_00017097 [Lupinus albus]|uniref:Putative mitochondrial carrier protein n=1 Tax=Lupinus albus TaxID=3870 RepID=A0A6A5MFP0_LUPAL|nr:putative mitochondrial carrier protein [Lupinus albus]KAF1869522.1 hypothetical protein Lal_00017097 [Lupinus albus]